MKIVMRLPLLAGLCLLFLQSCSQPASLLSEIKQRGVLKAGILDASPPCRLPVAPPQGLDIDLATAWAGKLGVEVRFIRYQNIRALLQAVQNADIDLAASPLSITASRQDQLRFAPAYDRVRQQLIYKHGQHRPRNLKQLQYHRILVVADSSQNERLQQLQATWPDLHWQQQKNIRITTLLQAVQQQSIDYTLLTSRQFRHASLFIPGPGVAFSLPGHETQAWAIRRSDDNSLYNALSTFFHEVKSNGLLAQLKERYNGFQQQLNDVDKFVFQRHIRTRLPGFASWFKQAAEESGRSWTLLAAIGYQESHWNPKAVSPTGVRGLMMLTRDTAREMKVSNRLDAKASILGGTRYLDVIEHKIPARITEPDRLWLALAGYNVGFGHLEDARILTQKNAGNPDKWVDVKKFLPRLNRKKWYSDTRHGYADGRAAVRYVDNIRAYKNILEWIEAREQNKNTALCQSLEITALFGQNASNTATESVP
ncbi:MAG: membrane-bound lytic murein transglycosylase MltF [gamma proteobacterium symbiont of Bathyaustriella thionipta]|nr:membrane-bound lytic murein transglycosylase MltF [gamma proteobacterium symbiont of Bathyaustriella thionipta]